MASDKSLLKPSIVVSLLSAVGSLLSFLAQLLIARAYGAGTALDAYLIASSVPLTVTGLFAAMLSYSLSPALAALRGDTGAFARFSRALLVRVAALTALLALLGIVSAPAMTLHLAAPLPAGWQPEVVTLMRLCWIWSALLMVAACLGCILTVREVFYLPAVATILPALGTAGAVACAASDLGIAAIPIGTLAGAVCGTALILWQSWPFMMAPGGRAVSPELRAYLRTIPAVIAATLCFTVYPLVDAWWAPRIGPGDLSYLGYAHRLLIAAGSIFVVGPAAVLVPHLAGFTADGTARWRLIEVAKAVVALSLCMASVAGVLAEPIVRVLFQRGSFGIEETRGVAGIMPTMLCGLVAMVGGVILFRGMFQLRMERQAAALGMAWTGLYAIGSGVLSGFLGIEGIAITYAAAWWVVFSAALILVVPSGQRQRFFNDWLRFTAVCLGAACVAGASAFALDRAMPATFIGVAVSGTGGVLAFAAVYWLLAQARLFQGARVWARTLT